MYLEGKTLEAHKNFHHWCQVIKQDLQCDDGACQSFMKLFRMNPPTAPHGYEEACRVLAHIFKDKSKPMAERFKFVGIIEKEVTSERTNLTQKVKFGQYEDLKPNKKGEPYESQYGLPEAQLNASAYYDRIAVLDLQAIGYEGKEFKVEERTKFALPPDAPEKNYTLKKVTPESIEVEYTDAAGATQTVEIKKGGTP
jgi:hypothetical protein